MLNSVLSDVAEEICRISVPIFVTITLSVVCAPTRIVPNGMLVGVTENNEATAIIVSEETGEISYAKQGRVKMNISFAELEKLLNKDFL